MSIPHGSQAKGHPGALLSPARVPLIMMGASAGLSPDRARTCSPWDAREVPAVSPQPHPRLPPRHPLRQPERGAGVSRAAQHLTGSGGVLVGEAAPVSLFPAGSTPKPPAELPPALPIHQQQQTVGQGQPFISCKAKSLLWLHSKNQMLTIAFSLNLKHGALQVLRSKI